MSNENNMKAIVVVVWSTEVLIEIPKQVTTIGIGSFSECTINEMKFESDSKLTTISSFAFYSANFIQSFKLPETIENIGDSAFENSNIQNINFAHIINIGQKAFQNCNNLTGPLVFPDTLRIIDDFSFNNCAQLSKSIKFNFKKLTIGYSAFSDCLGLINSTIIFNNTEITEIRDYQNILNIRMDAFKNIKFAHIEYIGNDQKRWNIYLSHIIQKSHMKIPKRIIEGPCGYSVGFTYDDINGTLNIYGFGSMYEYSSISNPSYFKYSNNISYVIVSNYVETISDYSFYKFHFLQSVNISNSVTYIGSCAFYECTQLTSINLPNYLKNIKEYTFYKCEKLTSINIPNTVKIFDSYAFYGCEQLTSINIPKSLTRIYDHVFSHCSHLTSINIPNNVEYILSYAFYNCSQLTSINISNNIDFISNHLFQKCEHLAAINIPSNVKSIHDYAFSECSHLTSINIPSNVISIHDYAFSKCSHLTSINIPSNVINIHDYAFSECSHLTSINIPNSVTFIGSYAFMYCSSLSSINISYGIQKILNCTFMGCTSLKTIKIPPNVTSIAFCAFKNCSLKSINIPDSVTNIDESAFEHNKALESIEIPITIISTKNAFKNCSLPISLIIRGNGEMISQINYICFGINTLIYNITFKGNICSIRDNAFINLYNLPSINIPNSIKSIGNNSFSGCKSLSSIILPNSLISIGTNAFEHCISLKSIEIPKSIISIRENTFLDCQSLSSINIHNTLTSIGKNAFNSCKSLSSINLPNSLISIGQNAFAYCSSLKSIEIPESITSIDKCVFLACKSLSSINFPNTLISIEEQSFAYCSSLIILNIPNSVTSIKKDAFYYCEYLNHVIINIPNRISSFYSDMFDGCRSLITLEVSGYGKMRDFSESSKPVWQQLNSTIKNLIITGEINSISDYSFYGFSSMKSLNISSNVESIGFYSFYGCSSLESITFPNSLISIGFHAFDSCKSLVYVKIPKEVTSIGDYAFSYCRSLTSISYFEEYPPICSDKVFYNSPLISSIYLDPNYHETSFCGISKRFIKNVTYTENCLEFEYNGSYCSACKDRYGLIFNNNENTGRCGLCTDSKCDVCTYNKDRCAKCREDYCIDTFIDSPNYNKCVPCKDINVPCLIDNCLTCVERSSNKCLICDTNFTLNQQYQCIKQIDGVVEPSLEPVYGEIDYSQVTDDGKYILNVNKQNLHLNNSELLMFTFSNDGTQKEIKEVIIDNPDNKNIGLNIGQGYRELTIKTNPETNNTSNSFDIYKSTNEPLKINLDNISFASLRNTEGEVTINGINDNNINLNLFKPKDDTILIPQVQISIEVLDFNGQQKLSYQRSQS